MTNKGNKNTKSNAGYSYLIAYKLTVPLYDYTIVFCDRWINKRSRTHDQMVQSARSGNQNIAEGNKQESLKSYIKLTGVARGSQEELLNDYLAFARQNKIPLWSKEKCKKKIRELDEVWRIINNNPSLPDLPNFPDLPSDKTLAVNLLVTLTKQASYFTDKLISSLKEKHQTEGGFTENLYKRRKKYRGY